MREKDDTDFVSRVLVGPVWMITKCMKTATDEERELCENPESSGTIDSLVPVYYGGKHYRNRFCIYCNEGFDITEVGDWSLEIVCNDLMYHWSPDENLLQSVRKNRCNIFFKTTFYTEPCTEQFYTTSECNVTGLWSTYNETIDRACNSYVDAFNMTYKNYFCWLCNTNRHIPSDHWKCQAPPRRDQATTYPPFVAILDLSAIKAKAATTKELTCKDTQFEDRKMVSNLIGRIAKNSNIKIISRNLYIISRFFFFHGTLVIYSHHRLTNCAI